MSSPVKEGYREIFISNYVNWVHGTCIRKANGYKESNL